MFEDCTKEVYRISRPGTRIVVMDGTEDLPKRFFEGVAEQSKTDVKITYGETFYRHTITLVDVLGKN